MALLLIYRRAQIDRTKIWHSVPLLGSKISVTILDWLITVQRAKNRQTYAIRGHNIDIGKTALRGWMHLYETYLTEKRKDRHKYSNEIIYSNHIVLTLSQY